MILSANNIYLSLGRSGELGNRRRHVHSNFHAKKSSSTCCYVSWIQKGKHLITKCFRYPWKGERNQRINGSGVGGRRRLWNTEKTSRFLLVVLANFCCTSNSRSLLNNAQFTASLNHRQSKAEINNRFVKCPCLRFCHLNPIFIFFFYSLQLTSKDIADSIKSEMDGDLQTAFLTLGT